MAEIRERGMTQYTPGPWEVDEDRDQNEQATVTATSGWLVAVVSYNRMEANARLIAAAPELLAALRGILTEEPYWAASPLVSAAIAKAEGRCLGAEER